MKARYILRAAVSAALFCLTSCSVKEDRTQCPCLLTVDCRRIPAGAGALVQVAPGGARGRLAALPARRKELSFRVRRDWQDLSCLFGITRPGQALEARAVVLEPGDEMDSLYACHQVIDCRGESARGILRPRKQWCTLSLSLQNGEAAAIGLTGAWNGCSLPGLEAHPGIFSALPRRREDGLYEVRLPRQGDASMQLTLMEKSPSGKAAPYAWALGELLEEAGFDWKKPDLDDVRITLDLARLQVAVHVAPWTDAGMENNLEF